MTDRAESLRALADRLAARDDIRDAWTAKSFTDRLFVVEVPVDATLAQEVRETLRDHDLRGADEVYNVTGATDAAFAGDLDDCRRYRFVDVSDRGALQSYVAE